MSQDWTDDVFDRSHAHDTDLDNMEDNFAALKSLFSGAAQPASMAACHPWFDTTKHVLKVRDDGDSAWLGLMHGDTSHKLWVYRNAALTGWAVDSGVSDRVLGLKGGATYTTGAATAGSWTVSGLTNADHCHQWYEYAGAVGGDDNAWESDGSTEATISATTRTAGYSGLDAHENLAAGTWSGIDDDYYTKDASVAISSDASWRPAAAVGTLQYLDL